MISDISLEYAARWSPHLSKDITIIEKVQRRATKLVPFLKNLPYQERLKALYLTNLYTGRLRGDLIQYFKFIKKMCILSPGIVSSNQSRQRVKISMELITGLDGNLSRIEVKGKRFSPIE